MDNRTQKIKIIYYIISNKHEQTTKDESVQKFNQGQIKVFQEIHFDGCP
jgi:hypothetical protein